MLAHAQSAIQGKDVLAHAREIVVENIGEILLSYRLRLELRCRRSVKKQKRCSYERSYERKV